MKVAVIPARGGSKRIPRKNIRQFAGEPIIAHSIAAALQSRLFDRVIVSTDDDEIAELARHHGAEVPFSRPRELADDYTGTTAVIGHAVGWLRDHGFDGISSVCCIYPTAPFLRTIDLKRALKLLESGSWRYVFAATTFPSPIFRSFQMKADGGLKMFFPEQFNTRSQDLPQALHDAGQFYWGTPEAWLGGEKMFDRWSTAVLVPRWRVQDIDTEEDWKRAESLLACMGSNGFQDPPGIE